MKKFWLDLEIRSENHSTFQFQYKTKQKIPRRKRLVLPLFDLLILYAILTHKLQAIYHQMITIYLTLFAVSFFPPVSHMRFMDLSFSLWTPILTFRNGLNTITEESLLSKSSLCMHLQRIYLLILINYKWLNYWK